MMLRATLAAIIGCVALAEIYRRVNVWFSSGAFWLAPMAVNLALACVLLATLGRGRVLATEWGFQEIKRYAIVRRWWWAPAAAVLLGTVALALLSRAWGGEERTLVLSPEQWLFVTLIPLVEEVVFRRGIGDFLRRYGGVLWGSYLSALVFSAIHASPDLPHLVALSVGLPLGPFLLGASCEALVVVTGRLLPAILFHMACNASVLVFASLDARWLDWLSPLYLK
jgi:membrane protease YdiL (CAAX protease family)